MAAQEVGKDEQHTRTLQSLQSFSRRLDLWLQM